MELPSQFLQRLVLFFQSLGKMSRHGGPVVGSTTKDSAIWVHIPGASAAWCLLRKFDNSQKRVPLKIPSRSLSKENASKLNWHGWSIYQIVKNKLGRFMRWEQKFTLQEANNFLHRFKRKHDLAYLCRQIGNWLPAWLAMEQKANHDQALTDVVLDFPGPISSWGQPVVGGGHAHLASGQKVRPLEWRGYLVSKYLSRCLLRTYHDPILYKFFSIELLHHAET